MRGLYRRGSIYWISYQAGVQTVRESTGTGDRKLAEGVLAKRRAEVFEGRWKGRIRDVKTPLHQAAQEYLDLYARPHKISWREDERILRRFESEVGSDLPIQQIDRRTVEQFLLKLLAAGLSKARVNRYTASLKCFFNRCLDWGKLPANPCRSIRLYPETSRTHWLEAGQVAALLSHCSKRLRPVCRSLS